MSEGAELPLPFFEELCAAVTLVECPDPAIEVKTYASPS